MRSDPASSDGGQVAIVEFETDSAARTALLLSNALIVDRPITVQAFTGSVDLGNDAVVRTAEEGEIEHKAQEVPDHQRVSPEKWAGKRTLLCLMMTTKLICSPRPL